MTGLMDLNDSDHTVKLIILLIETAGKSSYANHLCPVISVKAGKESQRKINCTNKKSAKAGIQFSWGQQSIWTPVFTGVTTSHEAVIFVLTKTFSFLYSETEV